MTNVQPGFRQDRIDLQESQRKLRLKARAEVVPLCEHSCYDFNQDGNRKNCHSRRSLPGRKGTERKYPLILLALRVDWVDLF
jgi:hypothetical protein